MRNTIDRTGLENPEHKRITIRNRQMGKFAYKRTNFWNNNRSCYSVWNNHMTPKEMEFLGPTHTSGCWKFRPPVHGDKLAASFIVFSYGPHHPLFVYDNVSGRWFENNQRVSQTTTQHRGDAHPKDENGTYVDTYKCDTRAMCMVARFGMIWAVRNVLLDRV